MSYCNYCENFADGHSIIILMNFAIQIKAKRLNWILNLGWIFEKQLIQMDFADEF
jgi:hypothetical protein